MHLLNLYWLENILLLAEHWHSTHAKQNKRSAGFYRKVVVNFVCLVCGFYIDNIAFGRPIKNTTTESTNKSVLVHYLLLSIEKKKNNRVCCIL